ncbi:MAG: hypothetical protein ACI845_002237 [Gammaproteobacteria bacterium]|jgi:hypothetical protein
MAEPIWVASKGGSLDDYSSESGFIKVHSGGWAISIMSRDNVSNCSDASNASEQLISDISLLIYNHWSPLYLPETRIDG